LLFLKFLLEGGPFVDLESFLNRWANINQLRKTFFPVCKMGCAGSANPSTENTEINKFLKDEKKRLEAEVKLLLLGIVHPFGSSSLTWLSFCRCW
jgi:hypothetical protein